jgi:DNA-binding transcriptional ArsR family regulator
MKDGPDISRIGALVGDPARANMLTALIDGGALTATELAMEAGVTKQTASAHLAQLAHAELITRTVQGRHHYFRLAGPEVAALIEALMGVAELRGGKRTRTGPRDTEMRRARICYDHLAGELGVHMHDRMINLGWIAAAESDSIALTDTGRNALTDFGINMESLDKKRRLLCRPCLDWSMRRHHLAGSVSAALLDHFLTLGWMNRDPNSRVIHLSQYGENAFFDLLH